MASSPPSPRAASPHLLLADVAQLVASSVDLESTLARVTTSLVPRLADECLIFLVEDGAVRQVAEAGASEERTANLRALRAVPVEGSGTVLEKVLATGRTTIVEEVPPGYVASLQGESRQLLARIAPRSLAIAPMLGPNGVVGAISLVMSVSSRRFTEASTGEVEAVAALVAMATESARAIEAAKRAADRIARLQTTSDAMQRALSRDEIARAVLDHAAVAVDAMNAGLFLLEDDGTVRLVGERGYTPAQRAHFARMRIEDPVVVPRAIRDGQELWIGSRGEMESLFAKQPNEVRGTAPDLAVCCLPLVVGDRVAGCIALSFVGARRWRPEEQLFLRAIGHQASLGLERVRLLEQERRAHAEAEGRGQELRALADAIPHLVWMGGPDGTVDFFNEHWRSFGGVDPERLQQQGWTPTIHPDDLARLQASWQAALTTGESIDVEYRFLRKDGAYRWMLGRARSVRDGSGRVLRWFGTGTEIHEQKLAAVRSAFLAQASELLGSSLDHQTTLKHVAELAVPELADWAAVDLLLDGEIQRVAVSAPDPEKAALAEELGRRFPVRISAPGGVAQVIRTGEPTLVSEITDQMLIEGTPDPELRRMLLELELRSTVMVPMKGRDRTLGAISFVLSGPSRRYGPEDLALAQELGRRAGMAVENARLYRASEDASRAKDAFLAVLSHELRTPLTSVLGYARMLKTGTIKPEAQVRAYEVIDRNAHALARLIEDLLDVSRINTGKLHLEVLEVELSAVVAEAVETVRPSAQARGVQLETRLAPVRVSGDPDRLRQVAWNLLSNAIKFTDRDGRVLVEVSSEGREAVLRVEDTGRGIDPAFVPHLFERFRQADDSFKREHGGLGLGLSIVKHLVDLHGGTVRAQSEGPRRGTRFTVRLPRRD